MASIASSQNIEWIADASRGRSGSGDGRTRRGSNCRLLGFMIWLGDDLLLTNAAMGRDNYSHVFDKTVAISKAAAFVVVQAPWIYE
jgi:hypothetical protein